MLAAGYCPNIQDSTWIYLKTNRSSYCTIKPEKAWAVKRQSSGIHAFCICVAFTGDRMTIQSVNWKESPIRALWVNDDVLNASFGSNFGPILVEWSLRELTWVVKIVT